MIFSRKKKADPATAEQSTPAPPPKRPEGGKPKLRLVQPAADKAAVREFQSDAVELEERKPPMLARLTLYAVVAVIGAAIYWSSVSNIDEIVVAPGKLATTQPTMVVQPLETSVVREIDVKPGDTVHAGQQLARLDPTFAAADADQLKTQIAGFDAQIDRLEAELAGKVYMPPAEANRDQLTQAALAEQRAAYFAARLNDFDAQIAHGTAMVAADQKQIDVLTRRISGLNEIDSMNQALMSTGNGARLTFLQARDLNLDTETTLSQVQGDAEQGQQTVAQAKAERQTFIEDYRRTSMESLVDLREKRASAAEDLKKALLRQSMAVLSTPQDATVLDVAQRSIGSVVQAAEPLFTLVPLNVPLEAEVSVAARDMGHLAVGDPARIKLDAFPFQKYGTLEGKVTSISQDSYAPENAGASTGTAPVYYKVRLSLGTNALKGLPKDFAMLPGLTVQAEINAGERSVISYFLYPLIRGLDESLHEP